MSNKPTTAELVKHLRNGSGLYGGTTLGQAADRLETADKQLSEFVWSESNPSEYVNELTETLAKLESAEKRADLHEKNAQQKFNIFLEASQTITALEAELEATETINHNQKLIIELAAERLEESEAFIKAISELEQHSLGWVHKYVVASEIEALIKEHGHG